MLRALLNPAFDRSLVPPPSEAAAAFHRSLVGYVPTPVRDLAGLAAAFGLGAAGLKDESLRLGLPAFKILGASWAVECALREHPETHTVVAASAGNHGRAVARVALMRGLGARIYLPERSAEARRRAIAREGAEVIVVDGTYEEAVARAAEDGLDVGVLEVADVGSSSTAHSVIDGYATLFAEVAAQGAYDLLLVPAGVGSLAAAAARFGARAGVAVLAVEPASAACLTASLAAGEPVAVATPGTVMAGLDCAEVSAAAWPSLHHGIVGTVLVSDDEAEAAVTELETLGLEIGASGADPLAALRALLAEPACDELLELVAVDPATRVLVVGTEGRTDRAPVRP